MVANVESMFYHGEVPWHRLGTKVDHLCNAEEALVAGGMDWEVIKVPQFYEIDGQKVDNPESFAIIRKSDKRRLSRVGVGKGYTPIQNSEAFNFLDTLVDTQEAKYETAGSLDGGRKIWLLARVPGSVEPVKGDPIEQFMCAFSAHDGTSGLGVMMTPTRVVCWNTLNAAIRGAKRVFKIRHTRNYMAKVEEARQALGFTIKYYEMFTEAMQAFAAKATNVEISKLFVDRMIPKPETKVEGHIQNWRDKQQLFAKIIETGKGADIRGVRGTAYGLYNAAIEYADHYMKVKGKTLTDEERLARKADSMLFGGNILKFKDRAFSLASDIVNDKLTPAMV